MDNINWEHIGQRQGHEIFVTSCQTKIFPNYIEYNFDRKIHGVVHSDSHRNTNLAFTDDTVYTEPDKHRPAISMYCIKKSKNPDYALMNLMIQSSLRKIIHMLKYFYVVCGGGGGEGPFMHKCDTKSRDTVSFFHLERVSL